MKKTIFITGASTGIGNATAKLFNSKGWNVIATMRNPEKETELSQLDNILVTKLDVLDLDSIEKAVKEGIRKFGKIDVLLNNAGYGAYGPLESFPRENIVRQFNTNVIGLLDVTRVLLPHFRQNKGGILVNISSIGGKVKIVEPGAVATDFAGRSFDFNNDETLAEYQPLVGKVLAATQTMFTNASPASVVANVIYEAATDGTNQLRYTAGEDAKTIIAHRKQADDASFMAGMKAQMGL